MPKRIKNLVGSSGRQSALIFREILAEVSRLTSLRTKCYDPVGVGCYDFGHVLHATFGIKSFAAGGSFVKLP